jgi:hypothetical protein
MAGANQMTWILAICTAGWALCGMYQQYTYETEAQCYAALDAIYKRQPASDFKFITCSPSSVGQTK